MLIEVVEVNYLGYLPGIQCIDYLRYAVLQANKKRKVKVPE